MAICPECKKEMRDGYVYGRGPRLAWNPEARKYGFNAAPGDRTIAFISMWKIGDVVNKKAYLCTYCGIIVIKLNED